MQTSRTYILVHGAWHGGWCWRYLTPLLQAAGHRVFAPALPGHGNDCTPLVEVTFVSYVDRIINLVHRATSLVVLVGHSLGGMVISQVAEECPTSIARLVYLTALLPQNGQSVLQLRKRAEKYHAKSRHMSSAKLVKCSPLFARFSFTLDLDR